MPPKPGPPLTKVTLNLLTEDVEWAKKYFGQGWSERLRDIIHEYRTRRVRRTIEDIMREMPDV